MLEYRVSMLITIFPAELRVSIVGNLKVKCVLSPFVREKQVNRK